MARKFPTPRAGECLGSLWGAETRPGRRRSSAAGRGRPRVRLRRGRPGQPCLPPPVLLGGVEMWAPELRGPGCSDSLNAALAHSPLRNRQRRGFPRGGHSLQPLYTPRAPAAASQNGGAHRGDGSRLFGPILWEARDPSTWNTSAEDVSEFGNRT
nr:uncharacterized protein LOC104653463 [Saimiri boliviensis boliviensis]